MEARKLKGKSLCKRRESKRKGERRERKRKEGNQKLCHNNKKREDVKKAHRIFRN